MMNYKKPALWVIIIAVIVCVGVAVCFLTNPKQDSYTLRIVVPAGSQEEFVYTDEEVSAIRNSIKIWSGDGLGDTEVLLSPVNKTTETGYTATYLTHGMPVEFDAEKNTWFKIGVNMQNPTNEDIIVYVEVENVEVRIVDEINSVIKWFDYTENPSAMDDESTINLPIYPDVTFSYNQAQIIASKNFDTSELTDHTILITGMPIWNAYFTDLTGDDYPEICATYTFGSGIIDSRIIIYDYAKGASYELSDRGNFDFTLRFNEADGYLYVDKRKYNTDELVQSGRLVFKDDCLQVEGFSSNVDEPAKYYLTIGAEGVKSIELTMPNSSGGCEIADGSLFKKGERSWLENLDGYTDLRGLTITALGENGEIIWTASIPNEDENQGFTHLVNDDWEITNIE